MVMVLAAVADVGPGGACDADEVETAVPEETLVFGRDDGVDEGWREVVVANRAAFFAGAIE
jgi:hypothetical protein